MSEDKSQRPPISGKVVESHVPPVVGTCPVLGCERVCHDKSVRPLDWILYTLLYHLWVFLRCVRALLDVWGVPVTGTGA